MVHSIAFIDCDFVELDNILPTHVGPEYIPEIPSI